MVRKGQAHRNLRKRILEVLDKVTSALSRERLAFQDTLERSGVGATRAVLMVDIGSGGRPADGPNLRNRSVAAKAW